MSKKQRKQQDDEIDKLLEQSLPSTGFSPALVPIFAAASASAALAAAYLFYSIHQMQGVEYYPLFAVVALVTVGLLFVAFNNTKISLHQHLLASRPEAHAPMNEKNAEKQAAAEKAAESVRSATTNEAGSFAALYNTLLFAAIFVLLGFFILHRFVPATYNYPVSSLAAAGLVFAASKAK